MDIEFHYYMTYLIAKKAGFRNEEAKTIATASQFVDDNTCIFEVRKPTNTNHTTQETCYRNYISQTLDITKPEEQLFRIYCLFHFLPGKPDAKTALRADGKQHLLNTTPNSKNARDVLKKDLESNDLYHIGIGLHTYADTWAHQNFVGYKDHFNAPAAPLSDTRFSVGHALFGHEPDQPCGCWTDPRLISSLQRISNKERFLRAARVIYKRLTEFLGNSHFSSSSLQRDLSDAIGKSEVIGEYAGESDLRRFAKKERIRRYQKISRTQGYGNEELEPYSEDKWFNDAIEKKPLPYGQAPTEYLFFWKNQKSYKKTDWYKFQEAVRSHQNETWEILEEPVFSKVDLPEL